MHGLQLESPGGGVHVADLLIEESEIIERGPRRTLVLFCRRRERHARGQSAASSALCIPMLAGARYIPAALAARQFRISRLSRTRKHACMHAILLSR